MENNTKKIVVLDRLNSPHIEQAIFILRDASSITASDAVTEAERIVKDYLEASTKPPESRNSNKKHTFKHVFAMVLYTACTMAFTAFFLSRFPI